MASVKSNQAPKINLKPLDNINGYDVRPGFYDINGATAIPCGVNFTLHSINASACELVLFRYGEKEPAAVIKIPEHYRIGHVYSIIVFGLDINEFEYAYRLDGEYNPAKGLLFNPDNYLLDPYAKSVSGHIPRRKHENGHYRARVVTNDFDWEDITTSKTLMSDLVIYELHVRGFTRHISSGVKNRGTFDGLIEKIPYLKELGINAVELMPVFEFDEMLSEREHNGNQLVDYWGYNPVGFFSPNSSYSSTPECTQGGNELKRLIRALKENGIEVILDVVFNHTGEGDNNGKLFSFKGIDNNIYYMLKPDGGYFNYSGCGNTLNCNHPIVRQMILESLRYWVINYKVDGFRFDLASILGRNEDGTPMNKPPLLHLLSFDPVLSGIKLIAEAWDAGGLYQVGCFPAWNRWAEWNGKYRDDLRSFLKGDSGLAFAAAQRIAGSTDMYDPAERGSHVSVNFITCHDGFTLYDLYSYNQKHNEKNGWNGTDGTDDNRSWNCGAEGETENPEVLSLRYRLIKNACAVLLCSRGTPMFLAGDEFCNTQFGNNNPYCQDNEISWDWSLLEKNADLYRFVKMMIAFRLNHPGLMRPEFYTGRGGSYKAIPDISWFDEKGHPINWDEIGYYLSFRLLGSKAETLADRDDNDFYIMFNADTEIRSFVLAAPPSKKIWQRVVDTGLPSPNDILLPGNEERLQSQHSYSVKARSTVILISKEKPVHE
jgi:glycogen operon protein